MGRVGVISTLLLTTVSLGRETNGKSSSIPPFDLGGRGESIPLYKIQWPKWSKHALLRQQVNKKSLDCSKHTLRNDYRSTSTKGLIVRRRWHISRGAFIAAWPLKSERCWVRGELAHTCITEEGTPGHPAASTGRVDPANPGMKADQRTGPESSAFFTTLSGFLYRKKKSYIYWFLGLQWLQEKGGKTQRVKFWT